MIKIVNMVGSGSIGRELDLQSVYESIGHPLASYDPEIYPAVYLRITESSPLVTIYRSGKYIITGGTSEEEMHLERNKMLEFLTDIGITDSPEDVEFSIQNCVCSGEIDFELDLNKVSVGLGLEKTEYEPEQFPGITYRPETHKGVALIFSSGSIIITGCRSLAASKKMFVELRERLLIHL